jgi:hypothetical protein
MRLANPVPVPFFLNTGDFQPLGGSSAIIAIAGFTHGPPCKNVLMADLPPGPDWERWFVNAWQIREEQTYRATFGPDTGSIYTLDYLTFEDSNKGEVGPRLANARSSEVSADCKPKKRVVCNVGSIKRMARRSTESGRLVRAWV